MLRRKGLTIVVALILAVVVAAPFVRTAGFAFVDYDDPQYVFENPMVRAGLSWQGLVWAFTSFDEANWHPLTWLSHMLDVSLFGMAAGAHHLMNVAIHLAGTLTLFLVFSRMTGNLWASFLTAVLFGVHPLHVESVAWVAERKDVLAGLFWMLTLGAYLRYARCPGKVRFLLVLLPFALGLMAKSMLVTLPFVLLLLDWWPLGRWDLWRGHPVHSGKGISGPTVSQGIRYRGVIPIIKGSCECGVHGSTVRQAHGSPQTGKFLNNQYVTVRPEPVEGRYIAMCARLISEKIPLLLLSAASSAVTLAAQAQSGAVNLMEGHHTWTRLANALLAYVGYLSRVFWPTHLAFFYPLAGTALSSWQVASAAALLCLATAAFIFVASRFPWLVVGWFWYLGTLVPVSGFVQVGGQSMADRYTYIPLVGVFAACVWIAGAAAKRLPRLVRVAPFAAAAVLALLLVATTRQVGTWKDSSTLFTRALAVTEGNWMAHKSYGRVLARQGDYRLAIEHYRKAWADFPDPVLLNNIGDALDRLGDPDAASAIYQQAAARLGEVLAGDPGNADAHNNLAMALQRLGSNGEALTHYRESIRLNPRSAGTYNNIGIALAAGGDRDAAIAAYQQALRLNPGLVECRYNLANALALQGRLAEAVARYREVLASVPGYAEAHNNLAVALIKLGKNDEALSHYRESVRLNPRNAEAHNNLGSALYDRGYRFEAREQYLEALRIKPDYVTAMGNLAQASLDEGRLAEAAAWYRRMLEREPGNQQARERLRETLAGEGKVEVPGSH